jgi:general L-amino acid transport system substrate-binding protein
MRIRKAHLLLLALSYSILLAAGVQAQEIEPGVIVERIQARGELICGINETLPGFGLAVDTDYIGFDVDICRAVAAALLGNADAVSFVPLTAPERPTALATGQVDMISRNTTLTLERTSTWRAIFGPVTFYDGQGIMVRQASGLTQLTDLNNATVCVASGTTSVRNIRDALDQAGLGYELVTADDTSNAFDAFEADDCIAFTADRSALASFKASSDAGADYLILPDFISKEPLAPLSPVNDPRFAEIISWTVWGLIQAEELGISSENVNNFRNSDNPAIQRFLGTGTELSGDHLGIANDFMFQVISQVGNYGEIYERYLGLRTPLGLDRGLNSLWTNSGLLYSPPFN